MTVSRTLNVQENMVRFRCMAPFFLCFTWFLYASTARTAEPSIGEANSLTPKAASDDNAFEDVQALSLEDLLNTKVEVVTRRSQSVDEAPAIVTAVTRNDIEAYGLRDLGDILRLVPGFEFGVDALAMAAPMSRGIWVEEGKALFLINGLPLNDMGFGNVSVLGTVPAAMVERVEIIRGPGSAVYGPFAEVAVINILTRKGAQLNGVRLEGRLSTMDLTAGGYVGEASFGTEYKGLDISASVGYSLQPLSRRTYTDALGNTLRMNVSNAGVEWNHIVTALSYKGLRINYQSRGYTRQSQDGFGPVVPSPDGFNGEGHTISYDGGNISYALTLDKLSIEPYIELSRGTGVIHADYPDSVNAFDLSTKDLVERYVYELRASYDFEEWGTVSAAVGFRREVNFGTYNDGSPGLQPTANPNLLTRTANVDSKYAALQYTTRVANTGFGLTAGGRYEMTSFGDAFAPRLGLTFTQSAFTAKLLYGRAFRVPIGFQAWSKWFNYPVGPRLQPETTSSYEAQLSYKLASFAQVSINGFYIQVDEPIVYESVTNSYQNEPSVRSVGAEAEFNLRRPDYGAFINASYFRPVLPSFSGYLTTDRKSFLGMAPSKINLGGYWRYKNLSVGPTLSILAPRTGQSVASSANADLPLGVTTYPALAMFNMNVKVSDVAGAILPGVDATLSVYNIFNAAYTLVEPYYGGHRPLPAGDRQITLGLVWRS